MEPKRQQPIKLMSNLRKIADLKLGKNKVDLMKDSIFGSLSSVTNNRESSGTLVAVLCNYYDPSKDVFELNDKTRFSFCTKEIANIIGMEDSGIGYQDYVEQCSDLSSKFPSYLMDLRAKFVKGDAEKGHITASNMKDILRDMTVDDDESKQQFRELMTYYLIEEVLLCSSNAKIPRSTMWWMVRNLEACESVNWAKATEDHLHSSMGNAKAWLEKGAYVQHNFIGCAPVLEAIIYERIPKMRPLTWSTESPPIQKYKSQRKDAGKWIEGKLSQLASTDILMCPHCTASSGSPLAVENTPAFSVENSPVVGQLTGLSITNMEIESTSDYERTQEVHFQSTMSAAGSGGDRPIPEFRVVWNQVHDLLGTLNASHNQVAEQLKLTNSLQGEYQATIAKTKQDYEAKVRKLEYDLQTLNEEFGKEREEREKLAAENAALVTGSEQFRRETERLNAINMSKIEELTKEIAELKG